jgi:tetratricopeptide (TPR) repeat protein
MLAVWGLGGAGKTQLVRDYLCRHRTEYKATFWIEAGRKESVERDFMYMYQLLYGVRMEAGLEMTKAENAVVGVKSWFSGRRDDRWLLVFDGADAVDNEGDDEYINLRHYIPDSPLLDVIVTTRSKTVKDMTPLDGVEVGDMEEGQAVDLFYALSKLKNRSQDTENEIKRVVKELGCFALAVTLAGTYVLQTPRLLRDIKQYLPEYRDRWRKLLSQKPKELINQYSESILTTWETSFQAVGRQCAGACRLLTLLAFFDFNDIFVGLFVPDVEPGKGEWPGQFRAGSSWRLALAPSDVLDMYWIEECFGVLQTYSLVQWKEDQDSYSIHKLVHAWGYERLGVEEQHDYSVAGLQLLEEAISRCGKKPQAKLRLVSHILANFAIVAMQSYASDSHAEIISNQLSRTGDFFKAIGRWTEASAVQAFVFRQRNEILGEEHPDTISAMSNLAIVLGNQGQLKEAAAIQKEVLAKRNRILGEEHLDTIAAMGNLANTLGDQGQLKEAAAIQKEVLAKMKRILGEEHPSTILVMSNLAITLGEQGQLEEAIAMQQQVLEKIRRILGIDHPRTKAAAQNLATFGRRQKVHLNVVTISSKKRKVF